MLLLPAVTRMTRPLLQVVLLLAVWSHAVAGPGGPGLGKIQGILALPEVFGAFSCDDRPAQPLWVYADAEGGTPIARIRQSEPWQSDLQGGCHGLRVMVESLDGTVLGPLPRLEFAYEQPGAVVRQQRGEAFQLLLPQGEGWLIRDQDAEFWPLAQLLTDGLSYLNNPLPLALHAWPGSETALASLPASLQGWGVTVLAVADFRLVDAATGSVELQPWAHIQLLEQEPCRGRHNADYPELDAWQGWIPLWREQPYFDYNLWFAPRGC